VVPKAPKWRAQLVLRLAVDADRNRRSGIFSVPRLSVPRLRVPPPLFRFCRVNCADEGIADHNFNEIFCEPAFNERDGRVNALPIRKCLFGQDAHSVQFEKVLDFFQTYASRPIPDRQYETPPLFATVHEYSGHEITQNLIETVDVDLVMFLRDLLGQFPNTAVAIVSDHGASYGKFSSTLLGLLENRLPAAFLVLPEHVAEASPHTAENLWKNQQRLTTHLDMHRTIRHIFRFPHKLEPHASAPVYVPHWLNMSEDDATTSVGRAKFCSHIQDDYCQRSSVSFLESTLPENRSCDSAGLDRLWCIFHPWTKLSEWEDSDIRADLLSRFDAGAQKFVGEALKGATKICHGLEVLEVFDVEIDLAPGETLDRVQVMRGSVKFGPATEELRGYSFDTTCAFDVLLGDMRQIYRTSPMTEACDVWQPARQFCFCTDRPAWPMWLRANLLVTLIVGSSCVGACMGVVLYFIFHNE
jgi:Protein of unknown function (DUF229)